MFLQYLKKIRFVLLWSLLCAGIFFLIFVLEEINLKAAVYPTVLCLAFGLLFLLCFRQCGSRGCTENGASVLHEPRG